jgi:hypothetical protein
MNPRKATGRLPPLTKKPSTGNSSKGLAQQGQSTALVSGAVRDVAPTGYAEWLADVKVRTVRFQGRHLWG